MSARRLNHAEYNNTIRDLLGVDIRPADNFPADTAAFGFDNISYALRFSPEMMEKYIDAAERSVRTAIFGPPLMKPPRRIILSGAGPHQRFAGGGSRFPKIFFTTTRSA